MAGKRNLSLIPRKENRRESRTILPSVTSPLKHGQQHFTESMELIRNQYELSEEKD